MSALAKVLRAAVEDAQTAVAKVGRKPDPRLANWTIIVEAMGQLQAEVVRGLYALRHQQKLMARQRAYAIVFTAPELDRMTVHGWICIGTTIGITVHVPEAVTAWSLISSPDVFVDRVSRGSQVLTRAWLTLPHEQGGGFSVGFVGGRVEGNSSLPLEFTVRCEDNRNLRED
jgi:hypothetical protein